MLVIDKTLEWIPCHGMERQQVVDVIIKECVSFSDMKDHIWVVAINHLGPSLYCYGLQLCDVIVNGTRKNVWFVKRIPEAVGPDVYDCPLDVMEAARTTNQQWRDAVRQWHAEHR
jgi:hypothetical protein